MNEHDERRRGYLAYLTAGDPLTYGTFLEYVQLQGGSQLDILMLGRQGYIEADFELCSVTPSNAKLRVTEKGLREFQ